MVDIQWQDGSMGSKVPATSLVPVPHRNDLTYDFAVNQFVEHLDPFADMDGAETQVWFHLTGFVRPWMALMTHCSPEELSRAELYLAATLTTKPLMVLTFKTICTLNKCLGTSEAPAKQGPTKKVNPLKSQMFVTALHASCTEAQSLPS